MKGKSRTGLRGLPRIKTSLVNHGGSESIPLLARTPSGQKSNVTGCIVPSIAAALVVTLVTLAATHHSSRIDPSLLPHDADDNRAALASMTHPVHVTASQQQEQQLQPTFSPTNSAGGPRPSAPGDRAEAVAVDEHAHAATHAAAHAVARHDSEVRAAMGAGEGEQADAALEAYAAAAAQKRRKQEVLEEKMREEGYVEKLVAAAAEQVRNRVAADADADAEVEEDVASLAHTDGPSAAPDEAEDDAVSPAAEPGSPPLTVVKAKALVDASKPLQSYSDMALAPTPPLVTKDERFEDASWATDDYRTPHVSTKDPGALNSLDPIVRSPGPSSNKTNDPVMKKMLKKIEDAKDALAESSVDDDGAFNETAFIDELVREDVVLAPDEEPEASLQTSGGNYLSGEFDADELARIVGDDSKVDADDRTETVPLLEGDDVEKNVREEVPLAKPFDDEEAEKAKHSEMEVEKKDKADAPSSSPAAVEPSGSPTADEPSSSPAADEPSGSPAADEPSGSPAADEPSSSPTADEPSGSPAADEPSSSPAADDDYAPGPSSSRR